MRHFYPEFIRSLPEADISFKGFEGWISQAEDHKIVFFEIDPTGYVMDILQTGKGISLKGNSSRFSVLRPRFLVLD
jgi:hypothetical protein